MDLFEETLAEVEGLDGERYVLRRNPARAGELAASRADKLKALRTAAEAANAYLNEHPRAAAKTQLARLKAKSKALHLDKFVAVAEQERRVVVTVDEAGSAEAVRLDGCYALRTDLPKTVVDKQIVHDRYRTSPELNGRSATSKTVQLEMRPVYLRCELGCEDDGGSGLPGAALGAGEDDRRHDSGPRDRIPSWAGAVDEQ